MRVVDLFAGCGGMSLGFQWAGYDIRAAFDNWEPALKVYSLNFPDHPIIACDLGDSDVNISIFTQFNPDMIIGGPPCQDFSSAGKRDESLGRADLTKSYASIIGAVRPKWFVMENVERAVKSRAFAAARMVFKDAGYGLTQVILDASYCGAPQLRKRLFLIGELDGPDGAVLQYLEKNQTQKPVTLREYFGAWLGIEHYYRHPRSYARRGVFSIDEPSPTIRGVNRPIPPNYQPHPGDTAMPGPGLRPLTAKERSMIQTFPENYVWVGAKADVEQMIGNAVPVKLAEYVACCILEYIERGPLFKPVSRRELDLQASFL